MAVPASPGLAASSKSAASTDRANSIVSGTIAGLGPSKVFELWGPFNLVIFGTVAQTLTVGAAGVNSATIASGTNIANGDAVQSTLVPKGTTIKSGGAGTTLTFNFPIQTWPSLLQNSAAIFFNDATLAAMASVGQTLASLVGAGVSDPNGYFGTGVTVLSVGVDGTSLLLSAAPTSLPTRVGPVPVEFALGAACVKAGVDAKATFSGAATPMGATTLTLNIERSFDGGNNWPLCNIGAGAQAQFVNPTTPISLAFGDPEAAICYRLNCIAFSGAVANNTLNYRFSATGQAGTILSTPAIT